MVEGGDGRKLVAMATLNWIWISVCEICFYTPSVCFYKTGWYMFVLGKGYQSVYMYGRLKYMPEFSFDRGFVVEQVPPSFILLESEDKS